MLGTPLHKAASEWAARGVPVFPCWPGGKEPAIAGGHLNATTDQYLINVWWGREDYNVAIVPGRSPEGWTALDVDPKNGGVSSLETLELLQGPLPETYSHGTPSGGAHFFFVGATGANSAGKLGPGLDTRSERGYVLVPPSATDVGAYTVRSTAPMAPLPEWIGSALAAGRKATDAPAGDLDLAANVEAFKSFLARKPGAPSGQRDNTMTVYVGYACDLGLSRAVASPLLYEWCDTCDPPLEHEAVDKCGLWYSRQNSGHPLTLTPGSEAFEVPEELREARSRFHLYTVEELLARPPPEWLIRDIIRERGIGHFFGESGAYKTYVVLALCMGIARERPVIYVVGEGDDIIAKRAAALASMFEGPHQLRIVTEMPLVIDAGNVRELIAQAKQAEMRPALVVLDTLSTAMGPLDETKDADMRVFVAAMKLIRNELGCAVAAVHHVGQNVKDRERGSYVLRGDVDFVGEIKSDARRYSKITMKKQRGAALREAPFVFEGKEVGDELAFQQIELDAYNNVMEDRDEMAPSRIGAILVREGRISEELGVTTDVLATWVREPVPNEPPAVTERGLIAMAKELNSRAKRSLYSYTNGADGSRVRWFVTPQPQTPEPSP